jgi:hypothetical protein
MVGLLATVLFSSAALAVDLGNTWARKRTVQKQVDIVALSVGWMLPMHPSNEQAIANKVASSYDATSNQVSGQSLVTGSQLINGNLSDGEILFQNNDGTSCTDNCPQMKLIAPPATVQLGLAAVMGITQENVVTTATVRITSGLPPATKTLPFWLPSGCGFGQTEADTTQGGTSGDTSTPTPTPTATATATATASQYVPSPVGSHSLSGPGVTTLAYLSSATLSGYSVSGVANSVKKVTLRAFPPSGSNYVDFAAQTTGNGAIPSFSVSTEITATPGDWAVYALAQKNNSISYSNNSLIIRVSQPVAPTPTASPTATASSSPDVTVGCVGQNRGNFGQLDSPRLDGGTKQQRLAENIALGLDHTLVPYQFAPGQAEQKDCGSGSTLLPSAQLDVTSQAGNNCITGDTGNDGPKMMDGLVQGIGGTIPGRLDVRNGHTTCPGRSDMTQSGVVVNNDVLSCYLRNGATLDTITQSSGVDTTMLDPSVMNSPRFVWLPVVFATDRAQKNYQPIREFVPGFITDETQTSAATSANGLVINGNSVQVLNIFTFNPTALPPVEASQSVAYNPDVGDGIVRLVG